MLASGPLTGAMTVRIRIETAAGSETIRLRVDEAAPAAAVFRDTISGALRDVRPAIRLTSTLAGTSLGWSPVRDLLDSDDGATDFVAEIEADGTTTLRFGDDEHGRAAHGRAVRCLISGGERPGRQCRWGRHHPCRDQ